MGREQLDAAGQCDAGDLRVHAALEAARGLAGQAVPPDGARHRGRVPVRRFQHDGGGVGADLGGRAAHHAGERDRAGVVGDHQVVGIERADDVVEGGQLLPRFGPAHHDRPGQPGPVERVQWLPGLQHHVVGDVDGERDRAHPALPQPARHPVRRRGVRVEPGDRPGREPVAAGRVVDAHVVGTAVGGGHVGGDVVEVDAVARRRPRGRARGSTGSTRDRWSPRCRGRRRAAPGGRADRRRARRSPARGPGCRRARRRCRARGPSRSCRRRRGRTSCGPRSRSRPAGPHREARRPRGRPRRSCARRRRSRAARPRRRRPGTSGSSCRSSAARRRRTPRGRRRSAPTASRRPPRPPRPRGRRAPARRPARGRSNRVAGPRARPAS